MRFLDERKRRRVVRVALVYGGVGFGVLQGADVLVPALQLPGSITTGMAALVILGFPLALGLAWAFDLGPEGVRRTGGAVGAEGKALRDSRWIGRRTLMAGYAELAADPRFVRLMARIKSDLQPMREAVGVGRTGPEDAD